MPKYSIVIPIYNTEEYLEECIDSILSQEVSSWELILVDNGSQDNAGAICDRYAEGDKRIRVIHQENRKCGGGRNSGLRAAKGEYVLFVDSDDYWETSLLTVLDSLIELKPEIACFGYYRIEESGEFSVHKHAILPTGECGKVWLDNIFSKELTPEIVPWCYAYHRRFLEENELLYSETIYGAEDFDFNMRAIPLAKSVVGTDSPLYYYRLRPGSIVKTKTVDDYIDGICLVAEAFHRMNSFGMANYYASSVLGITNWSMEEAQKAEKVICSNLDILQYATSNRKLLLPLIRFFGVYRGAKLYLALQKAKKKIVKR